MPHHAKVSEHTAKVLHLVEGAQIPHGTWVGGDSWCGSMITAVEAMKRNGVCLTWIIKQDNADFPMKALHAVLNARFGD